MSIGPLLLVLGALWVWLGFSLGRIRDRYFPGMGDWWPLVIWFSLLIIPIAYAAWNARVF
jgi:hypothetical protein